MSCFEFIESEPLTRLIDDLQRNYHTIRNEALNVAEARGFGQWPEAINEGGWGVHGLHWQGAPLPNHAPCTAGLLARYTDMVANGAFSLLMPGAVIAPHIGYTSKVLRLHFTLLAPTEPGCELVCGGERRSWKERGVFVFDDTKLHEAYNRTHQLRIILLLDIRRTAL